MKPRRLLQRLASSSAAICALLLTVCFSTEAQQRKTVPRIGYVSGTGTATNQGPYVDALRQGLRDLGYVEGKNFVIEYRGAESNSGRMQTLVAELIQLNVDVLVLPTVGGIRSAKEASKKIPVVMVTQVDPVAAGLVDSLARPGGNVTGLTSLQRDLSGKRLELLTNIVPRLSRVGVLRDPETDTAIGLKDYEAAAATLKIRLLPLELRGADPDLEEAFRQVAKERLQSVITITNAVLLRNSKRIADLALKNRIPSMYEGTTWVEAGGLMSYSANDVESFRRAAVYVDKILKGAKPADIPVEQPTKFELVINLKTAKQIGLTIPSNVLARADRVIR